MRDRVGRVQIPRSRRIPGAALLIAIVLAGITLALGGYVAYGIDDSAEVDTSARIDADVRIAAQRLEDGSVRFGLRVRDSDGDWVEPVSPRAHRFDPANVRIERWLVSSSPVMEVDDSGRGRLVRNSQPSSTCRAERLQLPRGIGSNGAVRSYCDSVNLIWSPSRAARRPHSGRSRPYCERALGGVSGSKHPTVRRRSVRCLQGRDRSERTRHRSLRQEWRQPPNREFRSR